MAKKWSEVEQNPQYQALPPEQKEQARQQYFNEIIVPQVTDKSQLDEVKRQFDADTLKSTQTPVTQPQQPQQVQQPTKESPSIRDVVLSGGLFPKVLRTVGGYAEPLLEQTTGFFAKPIGEIAGLAATGYEATTGGREPQGPEQFQRYVQQSLTYQPRTPAGQSIYNPLNAASAIVGKVVDTIRPEKPEDNLSLKGAATNAIREGIPQMIGILGAKLAPTEQELALKQEILNKQKAMNAPVDRIRDMMQTPDAQGLKFITPSEKGMEAQYGALSSAVNPAISVVNEEAATRMAANEIGLPKDQPFTHETIQAQVEKANQAYANLVDQSYQIPRTPYEVTKTSQILDEKGMPIEVTQQVLPEKKMTVVITPEFKKSINSEVDRIREVTAGNEAAFKSLKRAIPILEDELKNIRQDPQQVLNRIKMFRESAKSTFGKSSPTNIEVEQARAKMFIANKLEDLLEENLKAQGKSNLVPAMKEARKKLAQINAVEDSLTVDGKVSIKKMAAIDKKTDGKLLTGNLKRIAIMGQKYELGAQQVKRPITPLSYFDTILATASFAGGHLEGAALVAGKAAAPISAIKGKLQTRTPEYVARPSKPKVAGAAAGVITPAETERQRRKKELAK